MKGKEFKNLLKLNDITHENAAIMLHVARNTVSRWCKMEDLPNEIEFKINDFLKSKGYKTYRQMTDSIVCESPPIYNKNPECQMCKEKDQRIKDLKEMISMQKETISSLLQQIEPFEKHKEDTKDKTPARTG